MSLEEKIDALISAINVNTAALLKEGDIITLRPSEQTPEITDKPVGGLKPSTKKPVAKKKVEPAPVPNNKPPISFDALRLKVLKWVKPLTDDNRNQEAQAMVKPINDKFCGGKKFEVENIKPEHYQNVLDYIAETKLP